MVVKMAVKPVALSLWPYLWRSWRRKQKKRGGWHGANTAMVTGLALLGLVGVLMASIFAVKSLRSGAGGSGYVLFESCLNAVLMGWLLVPVMVGSAAAEGRGLQPARLGQFPLGLGSLLAIGAMGHLVQPIYWILAGTSLCAMLPLLAAVDPLAGVVAGALFVLLCAALTWSVEIFGGAVFSSRRGRELLLLGVLILFVPALILINGDYDLTEGALSFSLSGHQWLLLSADGSEGLLARARVLSPAIWVAEAARGISVVRGIGLLALALSLAATLAAVSLRRVMLNPPGSWSGGRGVVRAIGGVRGLPLAVGPLVIKELRYLTRTLDHLMALGIGVAAFVWIFVRPDHLRFVLPLAAMNLVFNESAIPLNNFGLDGAGADRYRLLPLDGRQAVLTKNLAYFALVALQMVPLVLAGLLKGALMLSLVTVLATASVCLLTVCGGNLASIHSPAPRAFFNFDSKEQTGGGLTLLLAALVWLLPIVVYFALAWVGLWAAALGLSVLLGISLLVYRSWLQRAGRAFDQSGEAMRGRLAGE